METTLLNNPTIKRAGIFGLGDPVKEYACVNFNPHLDEMSVLARSFADPRRIVAGGIKLEGETYVCVMSNANTIRGRSQKRGCVAMKTHRCVIVAVYDEAAKSSNSAMGSVMKLANYLTAHNF